MATAALAAEIDLSKPIGQNLKPDGIYWSFDEGAIDQSQPNPTSDGSGNGYQGRLLARKDGSAEPIYTRGRFGTAVRLHGGDDVEQDARVNWNVQDGGSHDPDRLDLAGVSFTAGAWIKCESIRQGVPQVVVVLERGRSGSANSFYSLQLVKSANDTWSPRLALAGGYVDPSGATRSAALNDNDWHHVAFSLEAQGEQNIVTFWMDGTPLGTPVATPLKVSKVTNDPDRTFTVGERNTSYYHSNFDGAVDDVFVTTGVHTFAK